jgi:hypothetical protein
MQFGRWPLACWPLACWPEVWGGGVLAVDKNLQVPPTLRKSENGKNDYLTYNPNNFPKGQKWQNLRNEGDRSR